MQTLSNNDDISKIIGEIGNRSKIVEKNNQDSYLRKASSFKATEPHALTTNLTSLQSSNSTSVPSNSNKTTNLGVNELSKSKSTVGVTKSEQESKFKEDISDFNLTSQNINSGINFAKDNKDTIIAGAKFAEKNKEVIASTAKAGANEVKTNPILREGVNKAKGTGDPLKSLFGISAPKNS